MGPTPTHYLPKGERCETSVEHGLPLWAEPNGGYCSRQPSCSPTWGSRLLGARDVGLWVSEPKPLGKTFFGGNPSSDMTYIPTYLGSTLQWKKKANKFWLDYFVFENSFPFIKHGTLLVSKKKSLPCPSWRA